MKLSIIVPVYNSEKFLAQCLESIFQQDLPATAYEVIVINDGSADASKDIILAFQRTHDNLVFITQINKGVSAARNAGLEIAKGDYVTFIDSDDAIERNSLKTIIEKLEIDNLDILYPKIDTYSGNGDRLGTVEFEGKYNEIKRGVLYERRTFPPTFYRSELLKAIRFNEKISFGEDTILNAKSQAIATRVSYVDIPYYKYTIRENSLSRQGHTNQSFSGFINGIIDLRRFQKENFKDNAESLKYFDNVYEIFVTRILELNVIPEWNKKNYDLLKEILGTENLLYILDCFSQKYPYSGRSFFLFIVFQKYLHFKAYIYRIVYRNA